MKNSASGSQIHKLTAAALLCAIGILIPLAMPVKVVIPPMSFTLGSHIVLFIAMFISPLTALVVAIGTTLGFFLSGLPIVVVLRAASQVVFVMMGAFILKYRPTILAKPVEEGGKPKMKANVPGIVAFGLLTAVVHALGEVLVCTVFFFTGAASYEQPFKVLFLLVGVGTMVHSCVDYVLGLVIYKAVCKVIRFPVSTRL